MDWIIETNRSLKFLDLELNCTYCPVRNEKIWALVNTNGTDPASQLTSYTPVQIDYIKKLIEYIVKSPNESFSISITDALNLADSKKKDVEDLLTILQRQDWIIRIPSTQLLTLAPRLLLELKGYLNDTYPDEITECSLCLGQLTIGTRCPNQECTCKLHACCRDRYFVNTKLCPLCKTLWS